MLQELFRRELHYCGSHWREDSLRMHPPRTNTEQMCRQCRVNVRLIPLLQARHFIFHSAPKPSAAPFPEQSIGWISAEAFYHRRLTRVRSGELNEG
jgi:hypothetical protein